MDSRIELHEILADLLGSRNVYFQPPAGLRMNYPAIVYHRSKIGNRHASDDIYKQDRSYDLTLIDPDPDSPIAEKLLKLKYCSFDRAFVSDSLNHFTFTIYFK